MNAHTQYIIQLAAEVAEVNRMLRDGRYTSSKEALEASRNNMLGMLEHASSAQIWAAMKAAANTPVIAVLEDELTRRAYAR